MQGSRVLLIVIAVIVIVAVLAYIGVNYIEIGSSSGTY
jgi:hypothetical protein